MLAWQTVALPAMPQCRSQELGFSNQFSEGIFSSNITGYIKAFIFDYDIFGNEKVNSVFSLWMTNTGNHNGSYTIDEALILSKCCCKYKG